MKLQFPWLFSFILIDTRKTDREKEEAELMVDVRKLTEDRDNIQEQITQIENVTEERDEYYNSLVQRINQSESVR